MTTKLARLALSAVAASLLALPAFAQSADWRVDSNHSSARIAFKANPGDGARSITLGSAAASGILRVDNNDPANSTFQFDLYPALVASESGTDDSAQATRLAFRSEKASLTPDGKLKLTGSLTVTRVIRDLQLDGNEAYSGPVESGRIVFQTSREQSLILSIPRPARDGYAQVSTVLNINDEDFPDLVDEVLTTTWPAKAQDASCESAASSSEDYSGSLCTGSNVESRSVNRLAASAGEDYSGGEPISAARPNVVTVALQLRLEQQAVQVSAKTGQ